MARTLVASDNFNRTAGTTLPASGNWAHIRNTANQPAPPQIDATGTKVTARDSGGNYQVCRWIGAGSFGNDQYAKATALGMGFSGTPYRPGVVVRCSADTDAGADFYAFYIKDDASNGSNKTTLLVKMVNGTETVIRTITTVSWTNGDTIELEASGSSLLTYKNGVLLFTDTDSALTTGLPGLALGGDQDVTPYLDDWEGGNLSAGTVIAPLAMNAYRRART